MMKIVSLILALLASSAWAGKSCIQETNPCNPDLLCSFKAEWESKAYLYAQYAANDPARRGMKKTRDGILWEGTLYTESMNEARAMGEADLATIKERAAQIFQEKLRKEAEKFEQSQCDISGKLDFSKLAKKGYMGMYTLEKDCSVWVNYYGGQYDPKSFGKSDSVCEEFYNRDFAHEQIHQKACLRAKKMKKPSKRAQIEFTIREEMKAYRHSMKLTEAYYRILLAQCSSKIPNNNNVRRQLKNITDLLKDYEARTSK